MTDEQLYNEINYFRARQLTKKLLDANLITEDMVRENCVLIDIGLSSLNGKLVGDISEGAKIHKAAAYTPVPGGVGVLSNLMVMETLTRNL